MANPLQNRAQVYGNSQNTLKSPTPMPEAKDENLLDGLDLSGITTNTTPVATEAEAASPAEENLLEGVDVFAPVAGMEALYPDETEGPTDFPRVPESEFGPEPSFIQANIEQFSNLKKRYQGGLAGSERQLRLFLEQDVGRENVTLKNGDLYWRQSSKEKFKKFDPDAPELVADVADVSRDILKEMGLLPVEVAGGVLGSAAGLGGATAGAIIARVGSLPVLNKALDKYAESQGLPPDIERNTLIENAIEMTTEAMLPVIGRQVLKRVPGSQLYKEAVARGEQEAIALTRQSLIVKDSLEYLERRGLSVGIDGSRIGVPGADLPIPAHHLNPDNPRLNKVIKEVSGESEFINMETQVAEDWGDNARNVMRVLGQRKVGKDGTNVNDKNISKFVQDAVQEARTQSGKRVEKYHNKAVAATKNGKVSMTPDMQESLGGLAEAFQFRVDKSGRFIPPSSDEIPNLIGIGGTKNEGEVRAVINTINRLAEKRDGITLSELKGFRGVVGDMADGVSHTAAGADLSRIVGGYRGLYREAIKNGLESQAEKDAFIEAMDETALILGNLRTLKKGITGTQSRKAIVQTFFTGKENLEMVRLIKKISPESFDLLREEFAEALIRKHGESATSATGLKSGTFLNTIKNTYGEEFMKTVFDSGNPVDVQIKDMINILNVTERIEKVARNKTVDTMEEKQKQGLIDAVTGLAFGVKFKLVNGVQHALSGNKGAGKLIADIVSRDGAGKYVKDLPKAQQEQAKNFLEKFVSKYKITSQIDEAIRKHGPKAVGQFERVAKKYGLDRAVTALIRGDLSREEAVGQIPEGLNSL